jgi:hypothetical protein
VPPDRPAARPWGTNGAPAIKAEEPMRIEGTLAQVLAEAAP